MKIRKQILIIFVITLLSACSMNGQSPQTSLGSSADWAYKFVIWNDDIYEILGEELSPDLIENEIGTVNNYSDFEGKYSNGFSNEYPVGTKLYKVTEVGLSEYIAVKNEANKYLKAINRGKYGG